MNDKPLVSVITPCFNGEEYLDRYFRSILNQTYHNIELIFVNDGSGDKTESIALSYRQQFENRGISFTYRYQENAGQAFALNLGLKLFNGEYLTWPDSDDVMTDDCIEKKVAFLEAHPEFGFCVCKSKTFLEGSQIGADGKIIERIPQESDPFFEDLLRIKNIFIPGAYMVRSSAVKKTIPDLEIYSGRGGQNVQLLLPVSYRYKCGYIDEVLNYYCIRENSHSHSNNVPEKRLEQLINYEKIVEATLKQMGNEVANEYLLPAKQLYGHMRFGNALDSQNKELIAREYKNLQLLHCATFKEKALYIKKAIGL